MQIKANIRFDMNNDLWIDVKGARIHDIQRACLMGGKVSVFELYENEYRLSYYYRCGRINMQFIGISITKDEFETQKSLWNGHNQIEIMPGTELLLLDNKYFL